MGIESSYGRGIFIGLSKRYIQRSKLLLISFDLRYVHTRVAFARSMDLKRPRKMRQL